MGTTRRDFMLSAAAGCAAGLSVASAAAAPRDEPIDSDIPKADKPLKLLILGGTGFLGPHTVNRAIARGHEMTLFNRGKSNTHLFPDLEKLRGDRHDDLKALEGRSWDAVIDTSGYVPRHVEATASLLADSVKQYVFISSCSVYADTSKIGMDETAPVIELDEHIVEQVKTMRESFAYYGGMKALCEQAAEAAMPGRATNIRPGLIVGPRDTSGRYTYWPVRIDRGGEVLAPGDGSDPVQYIDVRDLAEWIIKVIEDGTTGIFNAVGPKHPLTMAELLYGIQGVTTSDAKLTWVDTEFLNEHGVAPWSHMPVWIPPVDGYEGFHTTSIARAVAAGLSFRSVAVTAQDTLDWFYGLPPETQQRVKGVFTQERETEVLTAWHAREDT
ncbi:MAG: NAD-dependent epimerase/dehydratase family protein [Phycisphaerales bacterium]|nr:NAD-dependent epimerase/dehydratase family protein [Phycisphaerales bacterium]